MTLEKRHYEYTGAKINHHGHILNRIRATQDIPMYHIKAGAEGGWVEGSHNLYVDGAWVADEAKVYGNAAVMGQARATGYAEVYEDAVVSDRAHIYGTAKVYGRAQIHNSAAVGGEAEVAGDAWVGGAARIRDFAYITRHQDYLSLGPIGSESIDMHLMRTREGHNLVIGCWHGNTVDQMATEVARRARFWELDHVATLSERVRFRAEYAAAETLARIRVASWEKVGPAPSHPTTECPVELCPAVPAIPSDSSARPF